MAAFRDTRSVCGRRLKKLERVTQESLAPPLVPEYQQTASGKSKIFQVRMVIEEKEIKIEMARL